MTNTTTWTHDITNDLADLREVTRALHRHSTQSDEVLARRDEAVSKWTIAEQLAHMAVANRGCLMQLVQLMHGRADANAAPLHPLGAQALEDAQIPRGQIDAPTIALPDHVMEPSEIRTLLAAQARKAEQLGEKADKITAAEGRQEHPLIKGMTAHEWVRFMVVHSRHHLAIIAEIEAATADA